jgi:acyl-CoA synthetase (AMP-forming)/AMP-acid ligase II
MALQRLRQTIQHLVGGHDASPTQLSLVHGPTEPALLNLSMGQLLEEQAKKFPDRDAIVVPWSDARYTFRALNERSKEVAQGLVAMGVESQDRIGIFSGNCERYIELFFAVCRIGAIFVVLNPAYAPIECENALRHAGKCPPEPEAGTFY